MSKKGSLLVYLYFINTLTLLGIYMFNYTESIFVNSIFFLLVILLNRVLEDNQSNNSIKKLLYVSEICFVIFVIFIMIFKEVYFTQYKLLILPSILLSLLLSFKLKKQY